MARRRALRLSTRVTLFFATTALLGGIGLTVTTYLFARNSLLDQRTVAAEAAATDNAVGLNEVLGDDPQRNAQPVFAIDADPDGWATLITSDGEDVTSKFGFSAADFPSDLVETVKRG